MFERTLFDKLLRRLKSGGVTVHYWDGTTTHYGPAKPYFELILHHPRAVRAIMRQFTLGFGEAYMDGAIDIAGDITQIGRLIAENRSAFAALTKLSNLRRRQPNRPGRQRHLIQHHYDLGNDFYRLWLDKSMTYSCAYFRHADDTLEAAQSQKVEHILRKLQLSPGQTLLDIGCGWGQLLIAAAQKTPGLRGRGITLSAEQFKLATERVAAAGLKDRITIELISYHDLAARDLKFDRIVSVGMYEHVGYRNHAGYFRAVKQMLAPNGLSVLHTISTEHLQPNDAWIDKYIFPGGFLPTVAETTKLMEAHGFELQDYENLRYHYALTLDEWLRRFESHRDEVKAMYDERFYRMWRLYLGGSIAGFRYSDLTLSQFVMTPGPNPHLPLTREFLYQ
ncbi:MAG TPA: cyclopropane-fatty-acyl-phospholipid synthase family protein [Candidatus Saccharimonadia bacterium]|nr:cyclopropane-fatty-acyl-phospholipid synthase family protein [Candidatus Saccharimonadia bacterium]